MPCSQLILLLKVTAGERTAPSEPSNYRSPDPMIDLDFEVDTAVVERDGVWIKRGFSMARLEEDLFAMPMWFMADDVVLLGRGRIPIYTFAREVDLIRSLPTRKQARIEPPGGGGLFLRLTDGEVHIKSLRGTEASVPYAELLTAWERFASKVRQFFLERFPLMLEHKIIGNWLRES